MTAHYRSLYALLSARIRLGAEFPDEADIRRDLYAAWEVLSNSERHCLLAPGCLERSTDGALLREG